MIDKTKLSYVIYKEKVNDAQVDIDKRIKKNNEVLISQSSNKVETDKSCYYIITNKENFNSFRGLKPDKIIMDSPIDDGFQLLTSVGIVDFIEYVEYEELNSKKEQIIEENNCIIMHFILNIIAITTLFISIYTTTYSNQVNVIVKPMCIGVLFVLLVSMIHQLKHIKEVE